MVISKKTDINFVLMLLNLNKFFIEIPHSYNFYAFYLYRQISSDVKRFLKTLLKVNYTKKLSFYERRAFDSDLGAFRLYTWYRTKAKSERMAPDT